MDYKRSLYCILITRWGSSVTQRVALGVTLRVALRVTLLRSKRKWRVYDLVNMCLLGGRFVGSPVGGDHGSPSGVAGVAFVLAVAQLLAVATFEVGVTSRNGARGQSRARLLLLLRAARSRQTSGGVPIFEGLEMKIQGINFFVQGVGGSIVSAGIAETKDEEGAPSTGIAAAVGLLGVSWRRSSWLAASKAP